jgi:hypothetical protein
LDDGGHAGTGDPSNGVHEGALDAVEQQDADEQDAGDDEQAQANHAHVHGAGAEVGVTEQLDDRRDRVEAGPEAPLRRQPPPWSMIYSAILVWQLIASMVTMHPFSVSNANNASMAVISLDIAPVATCPSTHEISALFASPQK